MIASNPLKGLCLLLACLKLHSAFAANWDIEYWQTFVSKSWEQDRCKLYTNGEIRLHNDLKKVYYYRVTEAFAYQASDWLGLEAHYAFVYSIPTADTKFENTHRLEFEINPSFKLCNGIGIISRNRYELQKRQHNNHLQSIFRHRTTASYPLSECGRLKAISCSDEVHFDLNKSKFTQNRFRPIILTVEVATESFIDCYVMIRNFSKISTGRWYQSFVFGSDLNF